PLSAMNIGGTTTFNVTNLPTVTTSGDQTYNAAVTLSKDTTLTSNATGNIHFVSTVDGAKALTLTTGGTATFDVAVGNGTALTSLTTTGSTTAAINGGSVKTSGVQSYAGPVTIGTSD